MLGHAPPADRPRLDRGAVGHQPSPRAQRDPRRGGDRARTSRTCSRSRTVWSQAREVTFRGDAHSLALTYTSEAFCRSVTVASSEPATVTREGFAYALMLAPGGQWTTTLTITPSAAQRTAAFAPRAARGSLEELSADKVGGARGVARERSRPCRERPDADAHLPRQPQRPRRAAASIRTSARTPRCRRPDCPGSWRCSAATPSSRASRRCPTCPGWQPPRCACSPPARRACATTSTSASPARSSTSCASASSPPAASYLTPPTTEPPMPRRCSSCCSTSTTAGRGDDELVRALEPNARAALAWITTAATSTATATSSTTGATRLPVSSTSAGRTAGTRSSSPTARSPQSPIATCEIQGYVYDAQRRCARLAREVWDDDALAEQLERRASDAARELPPRLLDARARLPRHRARPRQAPGRQPDLEHRPPAVVGPARRRSRRPRPPSSCSTSELYSGWGVRTLGDARGGVQPARLPHRHGLAARQLADRRRPRALRVPRAAATIAAAMLGASPHFEHRLPEVFAGFPPR